MKYTSRDVQSNIKNLVEDVKVETHVWQPGSEADPGMILLKCLAANVDLVSFNLDTQVDEMYLQSATQIKSVRRLGVANGYQPKWYRAARTTVCIENLSNEEVELNFTIPPSTDNCNDLFASKNAMDDLTSIPYYIIPQNDIRGQDRPTLKPKGTKDFLGRRDVIYRQAAQGVLKSVIINPAMLNTDGSYINSLTTRLTAQNVDEELIWVEEVATSLEPDETVKWTYDSGSGLIGGSVDEPKYQVTADDYNNIILVFNAAINNTIQKGNRIQIFYLETYGVVGEITENVLELSIRNQELASLLRITHPGNTIDSADGRALTGRAPQTAHEAALEAKNYVNTNDSIITLPNFNAWVRRQPGVSAGVAVDCQKALELNLALYYNQSMKDDLKGKKYLKSSWYTQTVNGVETQVDTFNNGMCDFPANIDANGRLWDPLLGADLPLPDDCRQFLVYKLLYFIVYNNFLKEYNTGYLTEEGTEQVFPCAEWAGTPDASRPYRRYRPSIYIRQMLQRNYRETQNLTCSIDFGFLRVFEWCVNGEIYTRKPIKQSEAAALVTKVMTALKARFHAKNMEVGQLPRFVDVVDCVQSCDDNIRYFDAGLLDVPMIQWCPVRDADGRVPNSSLICDIQYFNYISFARFIDGGDDVPAGKVYSDIHVAAECILPEV